ncbi:MAG: diguanylate cyclase [Polaromonas sp.]|nr:diguanylate cyclase [Polaromonas sp.]
MRPSSHSFASRRRAKDLRWLANTLWLVLGIFCWALHGAAQATPRVVKVGVYSNEPKIFLGADGQISGILGDLLTHIATDEDWQLQPVPCEWEQCLTGLQAGTIDLMPDVAYSEDRAQRFSFHQIPALLSWSELYKRPGWSLNSLLDLEGKRVALLENSIQLDYLRNTLKALGVSAPLVEKATYTQTFEAVSTGQADVAVANRFFGDLNATRFGLTTTPVLFQPVQLFYATGRGQNQTLLAAIDVRLGRWSTQTDSYYQQTMKRWMQPATQTRVPTVIWWVLAGLSLLFLMTAVTSLWLRRAVAKQTRHLRASEDKLTTILNSVDAYIFIKDTELRYQYANRKVCELFGRPLAEVVGQSDDAFFDVTGMDAMRAHDRRVIELGERVEDEETLSTHTEHSPRTYLTIKIPLRKPDGTVYALCGISTDITRHKQAERTIHQLAFYDALTGLPNRRLLLDRMNQTLAANQRRQRGGALLFIDVDNFKDLNDTLGHATGDEFLQALAQRLKACTRAQDTLARQGGDEFVLLITDLSAKPDEAEKQAREVGHKILSAVVQPFNMRAGAHQASVSIGITLFSEADTDSDTLYRQADLAMYQAKADGRNTMRFFNPDMQTRVNSRTTLEKELQHALQADELVLFYQPQVNAQGEWLAVEALVRWQHPIRGLVPPGEFIPLAESSGLILPLGHWVLETACRQLAAWAQVPDKAHLTVSVNVSSKEFLQMGYVDSVRNALHRSHAPAHRLKLELTESLLLEGVNQVIHKMEALEKLGVQFSLDDFGTGYSSLSLLNRLPLHQLKIDQSFVSGLPSDEVSNNIVKAIVTLGRSLGLEVLAEGVETTAQRDALVAAGCYFFQGYLFGKPAPVTD